MLHENDLNLLKLAVKFAKESQNSSSYKFDEYVKNHLKNENIELLDWKLSRLINVLDNMDLSMLSNTKKNDNLKQEMVSILSQMIEDGELGLYKQSDYDGNYVGISIYNGKEVVTPCYSFDGAVKL